MSEYVPIEDGDKVVPSPFVNTMFHELKKLFSPFTVTV